MRDNRNLEQFILRRLLSHDQITLSKGLLTLLCTNGCEFVTDSRFSKML
jgi:hypothetical protein